jgi:hypothetical protein
MARRRWWSGGFKVGVVTVALSSPFLTGAVRPTTLSALVLLLFIVVAALLLRGTLGTSAAHRYALAICAVAGSLAMVDLLARPFLHPVLWVRANAIYGRRWARLPLLQRYPPNIEHHGRIYGDLAGSTRVETDREWREEAFTTDSHGFRSHMRRSQASGGLELLVLGDSFAEGANTAEDETLPAVLMRDHGYDLRSLAMGGAGPWDAYVNLALEFDRYPRAPGMTILWLIFTGNDLDDRCHETLDPGRLPWSGPLGMARNAYASFRARSPVRVITERAAASARAGWGLKTPPTRVERRSFIGSTMLFFADIASRRARTKDAVIAHRNWSCIRRVFAAVGDLAGQHGVPVLVASVPSKADVYAWVLDGTSPWSSPVTGGSLTAAFAQLSREHGFAFLDLQPALVSASREHWTRDQQALWWRDDVHWNGHGQRVAASAIARELSGPAADER